MSGGFVSSTELDEERKKRQEEWERVRKPDDPIAAPEVEVCNRTLFEQLRDNKEVKDAEIAESKKFKNMIRGIDEDESDFLSAVDDMKASMQKQKRKEEADLLKEVAQARATILVESPSTSSVLAKPVVSASDSQKSNNKQASILKMAIKRKTNSTEEATPEKKLAPATSALKKVGVIPGIVSYDQSSDSNSSDSSDDEDVTLRTLQTSLPDKKREDE